METTLKVKREPLTYFNNEIGDYTIQRGDSKELIGYITDKKDAKLFCAAPDLLDALTSLYNALDSCVELTPEKILKAKLAIQKATT